jgi:hypothetical protein
MKQIVNAYANLGHRVNTLQFSNETGNSIWSGDYDLLRQFQTININHDLLEHWTVNPRVPISKMPNESARENSAYVICSIIF